ncbi:unnamed protein product [Prorocentrum cordatum]|uniref:Uncharacterized protein n=1 Tax=Prorocentrum cordatum TaxID=2364126 RepID=A0ABN9RLU4_9DINO|nr:unnamed protein product [Polarella glacialis]
MAIDLRMTGFQDSLDKAMGRVRAVLDAARCPCFASDAHHQYSDKYLLAEFMTRAAMASQVNCLSTLGLDAERLSRLRAWAASQAVFSWSSPPKSAAVLPGRAPERWRVRRRLWMRCPSWARSEAR